MKIEDFFQTLPIKWIIFENKHIVVFSFICMTFRNVSPNRIYI